MRIIFLDIDEVLNCTSDNALYKTQEDRISPRCIKSLNHIIDQTGAKVVITSTWRINYPDPDDLQKVLEKYGFTGEIYDYTPRASGDGSLRGNEIYLWIKKHCELMKISSSDFHSYVIIDDGTDMLMWQLSHYLHADPTVGLSSNLAYLAIRKLKQFPDMEPIKRLLAIVNGVTAYHRHGQKIPTRRLDNLCSIQIEMEKYFGILDCGGKSDTGGVLETGIKAGTTNSPDMAQDSPECIYQTFS